MWGFTALRGYFLSYERTYSVLLGIFCYPCKCGASEGPLPEHASTYTLKTWPRLSEQLNGTIVHRTKTSMTLQLYGSVCFFFSNLWKNYSDISKTALHQRGPWVPELYHSLTDRLHVRTVNYETNFTFCFSRQAAPPPKSGFVFALQMATHTVYHPHPPTATTHTLSPETMSFLLNHRSSDRPTTVIKKLDQTLS